MYTMKYQCPAELRKFEVTSSRTPAESSGQAASCPTTTPSSYWGSSYTLPFAAVTSISRGKASIRSGRRSAAVPLRSDKATSCLSCECRVLVIESGNSTHVITTATPDVS